MKKKSLLIIIFIIFVLLILASYFLFWPWEKTSSEGQISSGNNQPTLTNPLDLEIENKVEIPSSIK